MSKLRYGGRSEVEMVSVLVRNYWYLEYQLMRIMAGWLAKIPSWEIKRDLGMQIWDDAQHVNELRTRLLELRFPSRADPTPKGSIAAVFETAYAAADILTFLAGTHQVIKPYLVAAYRRHQELVDPLMDQPTLRILKHILLDEEQHLRWGETVIAELTKGPDDQQRAAAWRARLSLLLAATDLHTVYAQTLRTLEEET